MDIRLLKKVRKGLSIDKVGSYYVLTKTWFWGANDFTMYKREFKEVLNVMHVHMTDRIAHLLVQHRVTP